MTNKDCAGCRFCRRRLAGVRRDCRSWARWSRFPSDTHSICCRWKVGVYRAWPPWHRTVPQWSLWPVYGQLVDITHCTRVMLVIRYDVAVCRISSHTQMPDCVLVAVFQFQPVSTDAISNSADMANAVPLLGPTAILSVIWRTKFPDQEATNSSAARYWS